MRHINTTYFKACDHLKTINLSADNFKKILDLDGATLAPAIQPSDTGQRIPSKYGQAKVFQFCKSLVMTAVYPYLGVSLRKGKMKVSSEVLNV